MSAGKVVIRATKDHWSNTEFLLLSNRLSLVVDILLDRLSRLVPETTEMGQTLDTDTLSQSLMSLLSTCIKQLATTGETQQRLQVLVQCSYFSTRVKTM